MDRMIPGVDVLIQKLTNIHPSLHAAKASILRRLVIVIDNWIRKNGTDKQSIIIIAKTLDKISRIHFSAYTEMLKMTRFPKIYQQAINHLHWARLHKRLGGKLSFDV